MKNTISLSSQQAILDLAEDFSRFSLLAKKIQNKLVSLTDSGDESYLQLVNETMKAREEIETGMAKSFNSVEDLLTDLKNPAS